MTLDAYIRRLTRTSSMAIRSAMLATLAVSTAAPAFAGTWTRLTRNAPGGVSLMLLLTDGSVLCAESGVSNRWFRLRPDASGSYVNGTWTTMPNAADTRLYYSSAVLTDGRVLVAGGEYGTGGAKAEIFNPVTSTWTPSPIPTSVLNPAANSPVLGSAQIIFDANSKILPNGNVLITPVGPATSGGTLIFQAATNTWITGPRLFRGSYQDEASWVKLPDDTILTNDPFGVFSERYNPVTNTWINDSNLPVQLYDAFGSETGAALLLPNGKAFYVGATGHTAFYTPSGTTSPGVWTAGPDVPGLRAQPDAPGAPLINGKVLYAVSPLPTAAEHFPSPTSFVEYDYVTNTFADVNGPTGPTDGGPSYSKVMLCLPDGTVLYSRFGSDLYTYAPGGSPIAAGKPLITSISQNADGTYHLLGQNLNGISEGAQYGDDAQMDTNYPLVRLTDLSGIVTYARTFNWSSTSVRTGTRAVSTEFALPAGFSAGNYSLVVVTNGIASDSQLFTVGNPGINYGGSTAVNDSTGNGNSNTYVDSGESSIGLSILLRNLATVTGTGIVGTLTSLTPTITVVTAAAAYPNMAALNGTALNATPFVLAVSPSHVCGDPINLRLDVTSSNLPSTSLNLSVPTGVVGTPQSFTYSGPAVAIPDNLTSGVDIPLTVSGLSGTVTSVTISFGGTSCSADPASTTVGLSHPAIASLTGTLFAPSGTNRLIFNRPGGAGNAGSNFCSTQFRDDSSIVSTFTTAGAPYSGVYRTGQTFTPFNGLNPNGQWRLRVADTALGGTGFVRNFTLTLTVTGATCTAPSVVAPASCNPADIAGSGATYTNGTVDIGPDNTLSIDDFLIFLSAFSDATGCPGTAPCNPADIAGPGATYSNGTVDIGPDGDLSIDDFLIFLSAFSDAAGCP